VAVLVWTYYSLVSRSSLDWLEIGANLLLNVLGMSDSNMDLLIWMSELFVYHWTRYFRPLDLFLCLAMTSDTHHQTYISHQTSLGSNIVALQVKQQA
jgi:hypothetical protein